MENPKSTALIEMRAITKRFGPILANDSISLTIESGTIHAIVGENGAGKTTLMRILYGMYRPDSGTIYLGGSEMRFLSPMDAIKHGIGMVSQHYAIIPELSCLENLILGAEGSFFIHKKYAAERATRLADQLCFSFDWNAPASSLEPSAVQKLEILKLLWRNSTIMILDEPTAMISPEDSNALFQNLKLLASQGKTIILVTHRLREVKEHCSKATILRAGKKIADVKISETEAQSIAQMVVGGEIKPTQKQLPTPGQEVLRTSHLTVTDKKGHPALFDCNFALREGEMVGIAGVDGNGQSELIEALLGIRKYSGTIELANKPIDACGTAERLALGLSVIPEDRNTQALILDWSLPENAILGLQQRFPIRKGITIDRNAQNIATLAIIQRFQTKDAGARTLARNLSGGNQQRFVAARALEGPPKVLLAFQPTRGLDIRASAEVFETIRSRCAHRMAALVISFDLDELLENCDRIMVMFSGRLIEPPKESQFDRHVIGRLMVGLPP